MIKINIDGVEFVHVLMSKNEKKKKKKKILKDFQITVDLQWLEHGWLVYHGCFKHVLGPQEKFIVAYLG